VLPGGTAGGNPICCEDKPRCAATCIRLLIVVRRLSFAKTQAD
jgi:hypothetical protein